MAKKVKRVFLIRHGQSQANVDKNLNKEIADHMIELTPAGREQAAAAGKFLSKYIEENLGMYGPLGKLMKKVGLRPGVSYPRIRMWHSPYERARQTAKIVFDRCDLWLTDKKEHLLLTEQRFGIFDGLSDEERAEKFPEYEQNYRKAKEANGKMWPKMPLGDSRMDVCQRVHQAFGTFHRDAQRHNIENIVVVGHGTTNRAFTHMWMHYPVEWMSSEPNPKNCSIRLLENGEDKGYIFEGFDL